MGTDHPANWTGPRHSLLDVLWPATVLVGIFVFLNLSPIRLHDFWWHLKAGEEIVTTGRIPAVDAFSFTRPGEPYPSYAMYWLAESAIYGLYSRGGLALVIFAHSLSITAAYALLLWLAYRASRSGRLAAAATLFGAVLGFDAWNVRPQAITYLLGALYLWAIYRYRWRPRPWLLIIFPVGMGIWANVHGSFPVGFLLLAIWLADEARCVLLAFLKKEPAGPRRTARRLAPPALALLLACLACLANPRGPGIITYVRELAGNPVIRTLVPEWAAPSFDSRVGALFLVGLLFSAVVLALTPRRPAFFQLATFVLFGALGLSSSRGVVWFGIVMVPILAEHFAALRAGLRPRPGLGGDQAAEPVLAVGGGQVGSRRRTRPASVLLDGLLVGILLAGLILSLPWLKHLIPLPPSKSGLISAETPVEATRILLQEQPPGNLFADLAYGSYLIWAAAGRYPVFADTRLDFYPLEFWRNYR
jgi:hypothetical protein